MYTRTNPRLHNIIKKLLVRNAYDKIANIASKYHPSDLAEILVRLIPEEQKQLIDILYKLNTAGKTLSEVEEQELIRILPLIDNTKLAEMCVRIESDDAVDFLKLLPEDRAEEVLDIIKGQKKEEYETLLMYPEDTAGSVMATEYFALNEEMSVKQAIAEIKKFPQKEIAFYLYVIDKYHRLVGVVSLRSLLLQNSDMQLHEFMLQNLITVDVDDSVEEVAKLIARYDLLALPVLDENHKLLGVINVDDVIDIIEDSVTEDLYHLSGVDVEESINSPLFRSFKYRVPWLIITLIAVFFASSVVRMFENVISTHVMLASFLPIIAGMGGNSGSQVLAIMVRSLALVEVEHFSIWRIILKEMLVGFFNGLTTGILFAGIVMVIDGHWKLAAVSYLAMQTTLIISGIAGSAIPIILKKFNLDPAVSSALFLTTLTDLTGFFILLSLAQVVL